MKYKPHVKMVGDIIKRSFIIIVLALIAGLAGQAYALTPEQQTLLEGMKLSSQLAIAQEKAIQGQNVAEFNTLVDTYNAWIRQHFDKGADADALLMSKITTTNLPSEAPTQNPLLTENEAPINPLLAGNLSVVNPPGSKNYYVVKDPFKAGSDLSQFDQQQVRTDIMGEATNIEELSVEEKLKNF
jgi:hypothetical protein